MIRTCVPCKPGPASDYQDEVHGRNQRVHNRTKQASPEAQRKWRCTVCAREVEGGEAVAQV